MLRKSYCVIFVENMTPLIVNKDQKRESDNKEATDDEDDDNKTAIHRFLNILHTKQSSMK